MYVTSKAGTEILKSQYEIIDSINGIPTLETDYSLLKHNHTEPMLMLSPAFNDKYIMVLKEQESVTESSRLRLTGVHSFIYDFSLDRIYEEYTQYFSLENILNLVFKGTEYAFEVSGSTRYNALAFENFGDNDKMSLINQICDRWELEYRVKDNKVYFADQRGSKTTKQFRYKMNIHDSHVNLDISEGATYIRAYFGKKDEENPSNSTYVEKEMLHPLAEDFGVRHAKPYSNEVITQEETMQRYMKMKIEETWKLSVEIDVLDLFGDGSAEVGDEVWAIDERMDLKYKTRIVEKRDYYDVNDRIYRTKVVLGNKTFIEAVSAQEVTAEDLEYEVRRYTNKRIEQLKAEKDNDFNAIRDTLRSEFSGALAQSKIEVAADFDRMEKLLDTKSAEWTEDFNQSVAESKEYAEQQAQAKAEEVRTDLETVTSGHQAMIDSLKDNVMSIDDFIGDKSVSLNKILSDERVLIEDKINSISTWYYNILRGSRFDEVGMYALSISRGTVETTETIPFFRNNLSANVPYIEMSEEFELNYGQEYTFSIDYRTNSVPTLNYVTFISRDGTSNSAFHGLAHEGNHNKLVTDGGWRRTYFRFYPPRDLFGTLRIGVNFGGIPMNPAQIDLRLPYLTETGRTEWLYHQLDNTQSLEEVTRRITQLEDGYDEFVTRTVYNSKTNEIEGTIRNIRNTVDSSESIISNHENWILTNGSHILQSAEEVSSKVWLSDIHNPNIIPHSEVQTLEHRLMWNRNLTDSTGSSYGDWMLVRHTSVPRSYLAVYSPEFEVIEGQTYTITFDSWENGIDSSNTSGDMDYIFLIYKDNPNQSVWSENARKAIGSLNGATVYSNKITFKANLSSKNASILIGTKVKVIGEDTSFRFRKPKLELGNRATPYHNAFSNLTQRADEIFLAVQGVGEKGYLNQSDILIHPDYVNIGSQRLDGSNIGSLLRVSPSGIDMVAEAMRLSGDLYVDGDITSLAVKAIEGNFARLFANQLTANVITADHIQVGTTLIDKFFATSARIDQLITKTHFVNEMHALTLNVVDLNASQIRARLLTVNTIEAEWLKSGTALLDRVFSSTAMFERMMAKSGFVTTLNTVTIDTDQLTIRRPDGVAWVSNGMARFDIPVQVQEYMDTSVEWTGQRYVTNSRGTQKCAILYTSHAGRYLRIGLTTGMRYDAQHASTHMGIVIRPENSPSGTNWQPMIEKKIVYKSGNDYKIYEIDLGKPTFAAASFSLEFYRIGDNVENPVTLRIHRAWITG